MEEKRLPDSVNHRIRCSHVMRQLLVEMCLSQFYQHPFLYTMWLLGGKQKSLQLKALELCDENTPLRVEKSLFKK
jgi:hypothetical protein